MRLRLVTCAPASVSFALLAPGPHSQVAQAPTTKANKARPPGRSDPACEVGVIVDCGDGATVWSAADALNDDDDDVVAAAVDVGSAVRFKVALLYSVPLACTVAWPVALNKGDRRAKPTAAGE